MTFIIVWFFAKKFNRPGIVSGSFLLCYAVSRFTVEFFREPDENRGFILFDWMTMGQILTLPIFFFGFLFVSGLLNKKQTKNTRQQHTKNN